MTNDWFGFEPSPWDLVAEKLHHGDTIRATRILTLLEGESDEAVEHAFQTMNELQLHVDLTGLPKDYGDGEQKKRLLLEEKLAASGNVAENLPENDPLRLYLEEMARIPAFGDLELLAEELVIANRQAEQVGTVYDRIVNLSLHAVVALAAEFTGRGVLLMDLIQEGSLGLWSSVLSYDGSTDFQEYRDEWIRRCMAKEVVLQARSSGIGQKMQAGMEAFRTMDRQLLTDLGRNPTIEEMAAQLHVSVEEAEVYGDMLRSASILEKAKKPEPEHQPEDDQAVEDTALFQSRQRILDMLSSLDEQQAKILSLRFGLEGGAPCTPQEVGVRLGLTGDEVVKIEEEALQKLRREG